MSEPAARRPRFQTVIFDLDAVRTFPSAVELLRRLRDDGVRTALVTADRDSTGVLTAAGALNLFDVRVDGADAQRLGLATEPDPAMLLEAARRLAVPVARTAVVECALDGVRAARRGRFGLVVGVDLDGHSSHLLAAGADMVLADLAALDLARPGPVPSTGWRGGASAAAGPWTLAYNGFDPAQEGVRETLCTLANGYLGTRGAAAECAAGGPHYPGTYVAGVYNRLRSDIGGRTVEDEHRVNGMNWLPLSFRLADGDWIAPNAATIVDYRQELDMRRGVLNRVMRVRDGAGRTTRVTSQRLVSQDNRHLAATRTTFEAEDWSGRLQVRSTLDGRVVNAGTFSGQLANQHLVPLRAEPVDGETVLLEATTTQSRVVLATAARTRALPTDRHRAAAQLVGRPPAEIGHELDLELAVGQPVTVEKVVAVATSRDRAISTPALAVTAWVSRAGDFAALLDDHERAWARLWDDFAIDVHASPRTRTALTLHTFHVLQTASAADADLDAGLPARGVHGEAYRGHVFWDEMFVYPMLTLRRPELTRALLLYRHRRLGEARAAARAAGLRGALFPWQSGSDGREETPAQLYNARTGAWMPNNSCRQRHVGLAITYSVLEYVEATGDLGFLATVGIDLLVEIVRCFASMTSHDPGDDRYDIDAVMGPDEYHDGYPGRPGSGVRNNAYTNILLAWTLRRTIAALQELDRHDGGRARERLRVDMGELDQWERLTHRLRVPFHSDGVISQFDGFERLPEFDWDRYRGRDADLSRIHLTLAAEGDSPNNYRLVKQPDVLMLFYLLSAEDLRETLERLGYRLDKAAVRRTVDFYLARTVHGSTLSRPICSWILARADRPRSWSLFNQALDSDLADIQGGTTREGIHLGAMAVTVDMVLRCYSGLETREGMLWLHPALPPELAHADFQIAYRNHLIAVELTPHQVTLQLRPSAAAPIQVWVDGLTTTLQAGQTFRFELTGAKAHLPRH